MDWAAGSDGATGGSALLLPAPGLSGTFWALCTGAPCAGAWDEFPRNTSGVSNCTRISVGFEGGNGVFAGSADATATCDPEGPETTVCAGAGIGGSIGSSVAIRAHEGGKCTLGGRLASDAGCTGTAAEARMIGGGGDAHPQSNGTSLLTRSARPSWNTTCSVGFTL